MASNAGMDAIKAAAAKKRNAGGAVASALSAPSKPGSNNGAPSNAIQRRLAKGSSKSGPTKNDNDGDDQGSGY